MIKQKNKKTEWNKLLLPIIFSIAILPFVTRMLLYDCGLSDYSWFSQDSIVSDFFSYYKSYYFGIICIISGIILLFTYVLYKGFFKNMRAFSPLYLYLITVLLSTFFSIDRQTSLVGGVAHFENTLVLFGYIIICIYTYQFTKTKDDLKTIQKAVLISTTLMCAIGLFQMFGQDPIYFQWLQKLIIPSQYQQAYLGSIDNLSMGNAVALTLFNSNYAGVYLVMLFAFFIPEFIYKLRKTPESKHLSLKHTIQKISFLLLGVVFLVLIAKTYSRAALLTLLFLLALFCYFYRFELKQFWKPLIVILGVMVILFIGVDSMSDYRFLNKISATFSSLEKKDTSYTLEKIHTNRDNILIRYKSKNVFVSFANNSENTLIFFDDKGANITNLYNQETSTLSVSPFETILFKTKKLEDNLFLIASINKIDWQFCYDSKQGYLYQNIFGKYEKLIEVESFGFHNYENIASGRGYIWSRSLPLLKNTFFIGSGPDTFPLLFPQWDYVGKANNCKTPYTLIEKPHNLYLMIGIQTGVLSLLAFLYFCFTYLRKSFHLYGKKNFSTCTERIGLGCLFATASYLVCGLFNDSSIQTSPIFWVLIGLGMAVNQMNQSNS